MDRDLLKLARWSIAQELELDFLKVDIKDEWKAKRGTFVTITKNEKLRGCIGSLTSYRELWDDIIHNAKSAAFRDPRFFPLTDDEFNKINIEISILSPLERIDFLDEEDILTKIEPFKDGLYLKHGYKSGTFLPQVWEHYPVSRDFFNHLKQKAGLPMTFYSNEMELYRYSVEKCQE